MWYKVDFYKLALQNQLIALRNDSVYALTKALLFPMLQLHAAWGLYRTDNLRKLSYNSQVCYLRKALNDRFDPDLRRITVNNAPKIAQDFIYTLDENQPVFLGTMYIEQDFQYSGTTFDFVVSVPLEILDLEYDAIDALVDFYRLIGKKYKITQI